MIIEQIFPQLGLYPSSDVAQTHQIKWVTYIIFQLFYAYDI